MKHLYKPIIALLLVFSLLLPVIPGALAVPAAQDIVTTATGYTSAEDVAYVTSNGYILNWGARGEDCVFLSSNARKYYTGSYTYEALSKLSGGTSTSNAPDSALYDALQSLMSSKHTTYTTYGGSSAVDCKNFYAYTDCTRSDSAYLSTLYRGLTVSSTWDSGATYNQEHIWPKSKCLSTNEIGDIMHLRPANPNENSSRGNNAYGLSSGFYDPGVSVRGDCARTVLYNYVRWGNTTYMWGSSGVMESLDVLLQWMEEDPVDTWEMGRNDAVQSITGVRNVFVDYPEYAWLLFGAAVPDDVTTPSGGESTSGGSGADSTEEESATATLVTDTSSLKVGDRIVIAAAEYDYALSTVQNNNNRGQADVVKNQTNDTVTYSSDTQILTLAAGITDGTFALMTEQGKYLCSASSSGNYLRTIDTLVDRASWTISIDSATGTASVIAGGTYTRNVMRYNSTSSLFACYAANNTQKDIVIYRLSSGAHVHSYTALITAPTCETSGYTTYTCSCGDSYIADHVAAIGHTFEDGVCGNCGADDPNYTAPVQTEYYLIGYINGADYGCEADWQNLGQYKFVDGRLTVTFSSDSYVFVKTGDNAHWYMAESYCTDTSVTLMENKTEKLIVPGNVEITFTLTVNGNDSLTLSYAANVPEETEPTEPDVTEPAAMDYYLVGYINGANYGCEEDYENPGRYKFINGTLTATFDVDSYVFIKTGDNQNWYMTQSYVTDTTATLYSTANGASEKMLVPSGVEITFSLVENADGTLTLSYATTIQPEIPVEAPTLTGKSFSLSFESEILVNFYYTVSDTTNVVEQGMLVFYSDPGTADISKATAVYNNTIYTASTGYYTNTTKGIAAKEMGDNRYYAAYAKLSNGAYAYSPLYQYSPKKYATNMLGKSSTSAAQKALCVAMLNYGAAAQSYFGYNTGDLMNAGLTAEQKALVVAYDASYFTGAVAAPASKTTNFTKTSTGFSSRSASVSFEGAFAVNYYFTPNATVSGSMTLYYWNPTDYANASKLTTANATGAITMEKQSSGAYFAQVSGIAAKELDETYYVAGVYKASNGSTYCTGVIAYSLSKYCMNNTTGDMGELAMATAMYGYYAKAYFNK